MFWHLNTGESLHNWNIFVKLKTRKDLINKNLGTEMVLLEIYRLFFMAISPGQHNKCFFLLSPVPRIVLLEVVAATQCEELLLYDTQDRRRNPAQYQEKPTVTHHSRWKKENHVL